MSLNAGQSHSRGSLHRHTLQNGGLNNMTHQPPMRNGNNTILHNINSPRSPTSPSQDWQNDDLTMMGAQSSAANNNTNMFSHEAHPGGYNAFTSPFTDNRQRGRVSQQQGQQPRGFMSTANLSPILPPSTPAGLPPASIQGRVSPQQSQQDQQYQHRLQQHQQPRGFTSPQHHNTHNLVSQNDSLATIPSEYGSDAPIIASPTQVKTRPHNPPQNGSNNNTMTNTTNNTTTFDATTIILPQKQQFTTSVDLVRDAIGTFLTDVEQNPPATVQSDAPEFCNYVLAHLQVLQDTYNTTTTTLLQSPQRIAPPTSPVSPTHGDYYQQQYQVQWDENQQLKKQLEQLQKQVQDKDREIAQQRQQHEQDKAQLLQKQQQLQRQLQQEQQQQNQQQQKLLSTQPVDPTDAETLYDTINTLKFNNNELKKLNTTLQQHNKYYKQCYIDLKADFFNLEHLNTRLRQNAAQYLLEKQQYDADVVQPLQYEVEKYKKLYEDLYLKVNANLITFYDSDDEDDAPSGDMTANQLEEFDHIKQLEKKLHGKMLRYQKEAEERKKKKTRSSKNNNNKGQSQHGDENNMNDEEDNKDLLIVSITQNNLEQLLQTVKLLKLEIKLLRFERNYYSKKYNQLLDDDSTEYNILKQRVVNYEQLIETLQNKNKKMKKDYALWYQFLLYNYNNIQDLLKQYNQQTNGNNEENITNILLNTYKQKYYDLLYYHQKQTINVNVLMTFLYTNYIKYHTHIQQQYNQFYLTYEQVLKQNKTYFMFFNQLLTTCHTIKEEYVTVIQRYNILIQYCKYKSYLLYLQSSYSTLLLKQNQSQSQQLQHDNNNNNNNDPANNNIMNVLSQLDLNTFSTIMQLTQGMMFNQQGGATPANTNIYNNIHTTPVMSMMANNNTNTNNTATPAFTTTNNKKNPFNLLSPTPHGQPTPFVGGTPSLSHAQQQYEQQTPIMATIVNNTAYYDLQEVHTSLQQQYNALQTFNQTLEQQYSELVGEKQQLTDTLRALTEDNLTLKQNMTLLQQRFESSNEAKSAQNAQDEEYQRQLEELQQQLDTAQHNIVQKEEQIEKFKVYITDYRAKAMQKLQTTVNKYQTYKINVEKVFNTLQQQYNTLAQHIAQGYEDAVIPVQEGLAQHFSNVYEYNLGLYEYIIAIKESYTQPNGELQQSTMHNTDDHSSTQLPTQQQLLGSPPRGNNNNNNNNNNNTAGSGDELYMQYTNNNNGDDNNNAYIQP